MKWRPALYAQFHCGQQEVVHLVSIIFEQVTLNVEASDISGTYTSIKLWACKVYVRQEWKFYKLHVYDNGKGKGKVHPRTAYEGPEVE